MAVEYQLYTPSFSYVLGNGVALAEKEDERTIYYSITVLKKLRRVSRELWQRPCVAFVTMIFSLLTYQLSS